LRGYVDTTEEICRRLRRRQRRSIEEKLRIIEKTFEPGASVAEVALAHGVNANLLFTWRRKYQQGQLVGGKKEGPNLLPVRLVRTAVVQEEPARRVPALDQASGHIQIELPKGHLMVTGSVDMDALRVALETLVG
jgi:transposase